MPRATLSLGDAAGQAAVNGQWPVGIRQGVPAGATQRWPAGTGARQPRPAVVTNAA